MHNILIQSTLMLINFLPFYNFTKSTRNTNTHNTLLNFHQLASNFNNSTQIKIYPYSLLDVC